VVSSNDHQEPSPLGLTQNILNVGQTRAINILKEMADAGPIKKVGRGKNTEYLVPDTKK
jgi:hypothetical protein